VIITPDQSENEEIRMEEDEKDVEDRTTESIRKISDHFSPKSHG
jgi:hypothetical protein